MEENIEKLVINITNNFTKILSTNEIRNKYSSLYWGGNGVGDRWCKKIFNYTVIYKKKEPKLYSENDNHNIPTKLLEDFLHLCTFKTPIFKKFFILFPEYNKKLIYNFIIILLHNLYELYQNEPN